MTLHSRQVRPFAAGIGPAATMASADFWRSISTPLDADSTRQIARSPRVLRTHLHAHLRRIYAASFRVSIGLQRYSPPHPDAPPLSASCSSNQRFACGFLQIPSRPGHPGRPANTSPYRACRGLAPPSECALPGRTKAKGPGACTPGPLSHRPLAQVPVSVRISRTRRFSWRPSSLALSATGSVSPLPTDLRRAGSTPREVR